MRNRRSLVPGDLARVGFVHGNTPMEACTMWLIISPSTDELSWFCTRGMALERSPGYCEVTPVDTSWKVQL